MLFYNTTCTSSLTFYQCAAEIGAKSTVGLNTGTHRDVLQMGTQRHRAERSPATEQLKHLVMS